MRAPLKMERMRGRRRIELSLSTSAAADDDVLDDDDEEDDDDDVVWLVAELPLFPFENVAAKAYDLHHNIYVYTYR